MEPRSVQLPASGRDEEVRSVVISRLLRRESLEEDHKYVLIAEIPELPLDQLWELLARHGDLGHPKIIVERLIADLPRDHDEQRFAFVLSGLIWASLPSLLDTDPYADFVEKARPLVCERVYRELLEHVRGCDLFNAITKTDRDRPQWMHFYAAEPLVGSLVEVRVDELACRARLEARVAVADRGELLRLAWVLGRAGCADLSKAAWARSLTLFNFPGTWRGVESESQREQHVEADHWLFVREWVMESAPDRPVRLAWLANRVVTLEDEGWSFGSLMLHDLVPAELRDDIARILVDRGVLPNWAGPVLVERLATRTLDAWSTVFAWWSACDSACPWLGWGLSERKAIVMTAPLPEVAPDDFDEALLRCAREVSTYEHEQIRARSRMFGQELPAALAAALDAGPLADVEERLVFDRRWHEAAGPFRPLVTASAVVDRLLEMNLSPERAARIARMIKHHPELMRHPRIAEIAEIAGPLPADDLPAFEAIHVHDHERVALYRRLGGPIADARLREHALAVSRKPADSPWSMLHDLSWHWLPEVADDDLRAELRARVRGAPLQQMIWLHRSKPWLIDEAWVLEAAARHRDAGLRWDVLDVPPELRPFVEERVRKTESDEELINLLRWLEGQGLERAARLEIAVDRLERRPPSQEIVAVASLLATRSAWEKQGPRVVRAFVRSDDWHLLGSFWYKLAEAFRRGVAEANGDAEGAPPGDDKVLWAVHLAYARVLLEFAGDAARSEDDPRLMAALAALLRLDPPPPIVAELRKLARCKGVSDRARERIDFGTTLFKSADGRRPTFGGLFDATDAMARAKATRASPDLAPSAGE